MRNVLSCRYSSRIAGLTLATILTFICGPTAQAEGSSGETAETVNKGSEKLLVLRKASGASFFRPQNSGH